MNEHPSPVCCPPEPDAAAAASCAPPSPLGAAAPEWGPGSEEALAALAKAVGHPVRVRILRLLVERNACVCGDIVDELPLAQSTVSQHLKVLKDAGLVRGAIDGPRVCYCVATDSLLRLKALVAAL